MFHSSVQTIHSSDHSVPYSRQFDDVYYSLQSGLSESEHVFLQGSRLCQRLTLRQTSHTLVHTLVELGFGTGLNALVTAHAVQPLLETTGQSLHYHAIEGFPLSPEALQKALTVWQTDLGHGVNHLSQAYRDVLYQPAPSIKHSRSYHTQTIVLSPRVRLTLWLGDVEACLEGMKHVGLTVDTWYLDGFAPAKNPAMWSQSVFEAVAALSNADARVATYTAAGFVRRGLASVGFSMKKVPGFGTKREMLVGCYGQA